MNVRGLKDGIKPLQLIDYIKSQGTQILGVTETNFTDKEYRYRVSNHTGYRTYWADGKDRGEGVGIIISREIDRHNIKVRRYGNRIIMTKLLFRDRIKLKIARVPNGTVLVSFW